MGKVPGDAQDVGIAWSQPLEIGEELARVIYKAEELVRRREYEMAGGEVSEDVIRGGLLSDTLRETYCALSSAPLEVFSILESETSPRTRYKLMGGLLVAQDIAEREMGRAEAGPEA